MNYDFDRVLLSFNLLPKLHNVEKINEGLINDSFIITSDSRDRKYVLQKINTSIFTKPEELMMNMINIHDVLSKNLHCFSADFKILKFVFTKNDMCFFHDSNGNYWRMVNYIQHDQIEYTYQRLDFYELGIISGKFIDVLNREKYEIHNTLKGFHRLDLVLGKFQKQIYFKNKRYFHSKDIIEQLLKYTYLSDNFLKITENNDLNKYIVHNDPKLSNFLFNKNAEIISLIDWDTVMPGYVFSDYADTLRSIFSDVEFSNDDTNGFNLQIKAFEEFTLGFWNFLKEYIKPQHKKYLLDFLLFIVYEQALRFLTDYLQGDIYYSTCNRDDNLFRANSHLRILELIFDNRRKMERFIYSNLN